eukprot:TRINITY_DN12469_c0_g1_i2.p1 TRINITY_DN12469_c0_g1~~TRINITY_DN12469_c0_g1_i2.p1  ORF type:complete len:165 (+),score=22.28 TRINITY_DN12469_c0_g1_i2:71-565(+)
MTGMPFTHPWYAGEFDCCKDVGILLDVVLCGPCTVGRLYDALVHGQTDSLNGCVCTALVLSNMLSGDGLDSVLTCFATWHLRSVARRTFGLVGSNTEDCLMATFCQPCALYQMVQEAHYQGISPGHTCFPPSHPTPSRQGGIYGTNPVQYGTQPAYPAAPPVQV